MTPVNADRDILFGVFAVQMNFIDRTALRTALAARAQARHRPLGDILVEQNALSANLRDQLEAVLEQHVQRHGDAVRSLAALGVTESLRKEFAQAADPTIRDSLRQVAATLQMDDSPPGSAPEHDDGPQRFRRLQPHAKGGLGEVFLAHDEELNRTVALKEIQARHASNPDTRGRFLLEAEITGRLEHPGIVPVYGLGAYADGRPFYAMRFIEGEDLRQAIVRFHEADEPGRDPGDRQLAFRELLGRFVAVCNTVAFAHSRGVLHRDLKPANVMLGKYGETLVVDWGVAKTAGREAEASRAETSSIVPRATKEVTPTQHGTLIGTPAYMSPEQAVGQHELLGPASDVYSLGATLYTLLTGQPPVDGGEVAVLLFRVRQGQIVPPRQVKPNTPAALDVICRKAMALNPAERYPTALALAADVEAWLAGEKVSAWREPWSVRAGRHLRRHSTLYGSIAAAGVVGLISFATATALLAAANERERQRADGERQAREIASKRLEQIDKGYRVLATVFEKLDPRSEAKGGQALRVQLAEGLGKAAAELEGDAIGDARTVANLQVTLGRSMQRLGRTDDAVKLLEKAAATRAAELGDDQAETLSVRSDLASAYQDAGRLDLAIPLYEGALKGLERQLGADNTDTLNCQDDLATAYEEAGQLGRAISLHESTLKARAAKLGDEHEDTYFSRNNLAVTLMKAGEFDRALPLLERTVAHRETKLGVEHFDTLVSRSNLAAAYHHTGKLSLAIPLFEGNVKAFEAQLGDTHPHTMSLRNNLGNAYRDANRVDRALPLLERTLRDREAKLGNDHPATLTSRNNLAECYLVAGKPDLAIGLMQQLVPQARAKLGAEHPSTALFTRHWIETLVAAGQYSRAVEAGGWSPLNASILRPTIRCWPTR
jgi:tetratricopeptide (TPR) repeat protein/tRNA A-37 threonylcarbamoyl transferase component Bud32